MVTADHQPVDRDNLRHLLEARRRRLTNDVQLRVARMRDHGSNLVPVDALDDGDDSDLDVRVLEMMSSTLQHIDLALERLDSGEYGWCRECHGRIAEARLRALPFAVRCRDCETAREREMRTRHVAAHTAPWPCEQ